MHLEINYDSVTSVPLLPKNVSIIIPAYNEEDRIYGVLQDIFAICTEMNLDWQTIVSIDGDDNTEQIVTDFADENFRTTAIVNPKKMGKGGAIKRALEYATGEYTILMDADGSVKLGKLLEKFPLMKNLDMLNFDRYLDESNQIPSIRRFVSRAFNLLVRGFFGMKINDTQCGYKIARTDSLKEVFRKVTIANAFFEVGVLYYSKKLGFSVKEVPIEYRHGEGSTFGVLNLIFSGFISIMAIRLRNSPLWNFVPDKVKDLFYDKFSTF